MPLLGRERIGCVDNHSNILLCAHAEGRGMGSEAPLELATGNGHSCTGYGWWHLLCGISQVGFFLCGLKAVGANYHSYL